MDRFSFNINNKPYEVEIKSIRGNLALVEVNGIEYEVDIADIGDMEMPLVPRPHRALGGAVSEESAAPAAPAAAAPSAQARPSTPSPQTPTNSVIAPMPGQIFKILVSTGDTVKQGDPVIIIEAMKMENRISSGMTGTVTAIHVKEGDTVSEGAPLITVGD